MDRHYWTAPSSDTRRWRSILAECKETFAGERIAPFPFPGCRRERFRLCYNSGAGAIALAAHWQPARIVLLGYDCQKGPDGRLHHHADHPRPLGNCGSMTLWLDQFRKLARDLGGSVEILNASRRTALDCWPTVDLEEALNDADL